MSFAFHTQDLYGARPGVRARALPPGFRDLLPDLAEREAHVLNQLMRIFALYGFSRVKPSLVEYETALFGQLDTEALRRSSLRASDPLTGRMLAVRPDITLQIARLAETRLKDAPRPLRLSYAGQALRLRGSALRPERQFSQAGLELVGWPETAADAVSFEVMDATLAALDAAGVHEVRLDLVIPGLMPALLAHLGYEGEGALAILDALDAKDGARTLALAKASDQALFTDLLRAAGPWKSVWHRLNQLAPLEPLLKAATPNLPHLVAQLEARWPKLVVLLDPVERRGFEYQTGLSFTLFARGARGELGRGGRYMSGQETAFGASLFLDSLLRSLLPEPVRSIELAGPDVAQEDLDAARAQGQRVARSF